MTQHIHVIPTLHYHWNATGLHQHEIDANYLEGVITQREFHCKTDFIVLLLHVLIGLLLFFIMKVNRSNRLRA